MSDTEEKFYWHAWHAYSVMHVLTKEQAAQRRLEIISFKPLNELYTRLKLFKEADVSSLTDEETTSLRRWGALPLSMESRIRELHAEQCGCKEWKWDTRFPYEGTLKFPRYDLRGLLYLPQRLWLKLQEWLYAH